MTNLLLKILNFRNIKINNSELFKLIKKTDKKVVIIANHKSIFDAMKKILKNKSHYKNLAIKSKNNIRSNYNWKKTAEKYNNLFTKIYDKH